MMYSFWIWMQNNQHGVRFLAVHHQFRGHGIALAHWMDQSWWFLVAVPTLVCFSVILIS
jgi:hypothetical protein